MHSYDVEEGRERDRSDAFGLEELAEDSEEDSGDNKRMNMNGYGHGNGKANANVGVKRSFSEHGGSRKASPLPR